MDEIKEAIINLKVESKILTTLIDTILDSCEIDYYGRDLRIGSDSKIITVIKTFYPDEYNNRFEALKEKNKEEELA